MELKIVPHWNEELAKRGVRQIRGIPTLGSDLTLGAISPAPDVGLIFERGWEPNRHFANEEEVLNFVRRREADTLSEMP